VAETTAIEWTRGDDGTPGATWNPVTGCTKISPGCDRCYAETFAERWRGVPGHHFENGFDIQTRPDRLTLPLRWKKPRRVFLDSMFDLFHSDISDGYIARVWDVMARCPQHTFLILTKRPGRMRSWVQRWASREGDHRVSPDALPQGPEAVRATYTSGRSHLFADMLDDMGEPPQGCAYPLYDWMEGPRWWPGVLPNVWLGASVEDQKWADIRIPALLETPAAVRFLSAEPLLGEINLRQAVIPMGSERGHGLTASYVHGSGCCDRFHGIDWVIVGGESGRRSRPMDLQWASQLVTQCRDASVPVFVKQLGSAFGPRKGADMATWPLNLRVREFPTGAVAP